MTFLYYSRERVRQLSSFVSGLMHLLDGAPGIARVSVCLSFSLLSFISFSLPPFQPLSLPPLLSLPPIISPSFTSSVSGDKTYMHIVQWITLVADVSDNNIKSVGKQYGPSRPHIRLHRSWLLQ